MYPNSIYFGLKVVRIWVPWGQSIYYSGTWTLRRTPCEALLVGGPQLPGRMHSDEPRLTGFLKRSCAFIFKDCQSTYYVIYYFGFLYLAPWFSQTPPLLSRGARDDAYRESGDSGSRFLLGYTDLQKGL